jgi:hypothetical protein
MGRCDTEVFEKGEPLLLADTGEVGDNKLFEVWVQRVARSSGQRVDWHYSGGIAQVLVLGDLEQAGAAARSLESDLPEGQRIMRWFVSGEAGAYRRGVTAAPEGAIAGFTDLNGEQQFLVKAED